MELEKDFWRPVMNFGRIHLHYLDGKPADLAEVYSHREDALETAKTIASEQGYELCTIPRYGEEQLRLDFFRQEHILQLPLEVWFSDNSDNLKEQQNQLNLYGVANPS
jgi:hypothetical protein